MTSAAGQSVEINWASNRITQVAPGCVVAPDASDVATTSQPHYIPLPDKEEIAKTSLGLEKA